MLPRNDLNVGEAFDVRLGFLREGGDDSYRTLSNEHGTDLHPAPAVVPGRHALGLRLQVENVNVLAAAMGRVAQHRPCGMYEFAGSDTDPHRMAESAAAGN